MLEPCCHRFTAAEGGARLAATASAKNTLITECTGFISTRLLHEEAYQIRGLLSSGKKRSVRVCRPSTVKADAYELRILTDLKVAEAVDYDDVLDWSQELEVKEVMVCTSEVLKRLLEDRIIGMTQINVLVINSCHMIYKDENLQYIMKIYKQTDKDTRPRILAITYPLFNSHKPESIDKDNETIDTAAIDKTKDVESKDGTVDSNKENEQGIDEVRKENRDSNKDIQKESESTNTSIDKKENIDQDTSHEEVIDKIIVDDSHRVIDQSIVIKSDKQTTDSISILNETTDNKAVVNETTDKGSVVNDSHRQMSIEFGDYENYDDFNMYEKLEYKIDELEKELCCEMDLAEDIDGCKRLSGPVPKPRELIVEYGVTSSEGLADDYKDLETFMRSTIYEALDFLRDHRHDPTEIYGEELYEELKSIPNPTVEPIQILKEFLYVLQELGPYAADKAAFSLLIKLEKLKIKVPYERHFLLLRLCTTVLVKIRCYADTVLSKIDCDWEKITLYSTPKLMRLIEILEKFTPPDTPTENKDIINDSKINENNDVNEDDGNINRINSNIINIVNDNVINTSDNKDKDIDSQIDSQSLSFVSQNKLDSQDSSSQNKPIDSQIAHIVNLKESAASQKDSPVCQKESSPSQKIPQDTQHTSKDSQNIIAENLENKTEKTNELLKAIERCDFASLGNKIEDKMNTIKGNLKDLDIESISVDYKEELLKSRRGRPRRAAAARHARAPAAPHSLIGIVFINSPLMAKILFMIISELTRCRGALAYITCQYCAVEPRAPHRDNQKDGKRHEEVLKKFRMHECNLLLTTLALEEGIDLPRCNLVLRWDTPPSYRSHTLCRSRGRAARAAAVCLCAHTDTHTDTLLHNLATYTELDQIISRKCGCGIQNEPPLEEESAADRYNVIIKPYTPTQGEKVTKTCEELPKNSDKNPESCEGTPKKSEATPKNDICNHNHSDYDNHSNDYDKDSNKTIYEEDFKENEIDLNVSKLNEINLKQIDNFKNLSIKDDSNKSQLNKECIEKDNSQNHNFDTQEQNDNRNHEKCNHNQNPTHNQSEEIVIESDSYIKSDHPNQPIDNQTEKMVTESNSYIKSDHPNQSIDNQTEKMVTESNSYIKSDHPNQSIDNQTEKMVTESNSYIKSDNHNQPEKIDTESDKLKNDIECVASVDLNSAISLINRYCAKLPSDTFTRLAPQWWTEKVKLPGEIEDAYICTLRLPLNCPVKYNIVGHPMPSAVLARRVVALQACRILHRSGELDDQLMPIGKENFKAAELETNAPVGNDRGDLDDAARPGTTKRRQYYYKRTAEVFTDCQPIIDATDSEVENESYDTQAEEEASKKGVKRNTLYLLSCVLQCALPERYNTRGRRLHAPQLADTALALLMATDCVNNLQIPSFPVYTRSGEVRVSVEHIPGADVRMSPRRGRLVRRFMRFVFTEVLRVRRKGMKLQSEGSTKNNYYIVPTIKSTSADGSTKIDIDWPFLELIYQHTEEKKLSEIEKPLIWVQETEGDEKGKKDEEKFITNPLLKQGEVFVFDAEKYMEAVVTPWYRNQDQPQFFLVAEICWDLSPDSAFPSCAHATFRSYYRNKYRVELTQRDQPLLDVDHTSARLNLLTPRYVNRKGVALPVSSERTRRNKRDRLDQKQILVPELCRRHPFAAPLWFATVALPCVLYRINALLIADEIRRAVAIDVGLGIPKIDNTTMPGFQWPPLDFGWSLAEVLSADAEKNEKKKEEDKEQKEKESRDKEEKLKEVEDKKELNRTEEKTDDVTEEKTINDILQEKLDSESGFEIGTWSNDMASSIPDSEFDEMMEPLPSNLTFCTSASGGVNWCDPVQKPKAEFQPTRGYRRTFSMADSDCSFMSSDFDTDDSDFDSDASDDDDADASGFCNSKNSNAAVGVRIEYKTAHEAEAVDLEPRRASQPAPARDAEHEMRDREELVQLLKSGHGDVEYLNRFRQAVEKHKQTIKANGEIITHNTPIKDILAETKTSTNQPTDKTIDYKQMFPYKTDELEIVDGKISIQSIERNKRRLLTELKESLTGEEVKKMNCFSMKDVDIDSPGYVNEKLVNIGFDSKEKYEQKLRSYKGREFGPYYMERKNQNGKFDFDYQPDLEGHPGPSPSVILQALTMSNANDGINLERLETIGDSFLKFAITAYLYCSHPTVHEGKLSHMRSKQVSNLNLYRLGRASRLGARMTASKFEPHDNWLPPCHRAPPPHQGDVNSESSNVETQDANGCYIPYNLITQHSIPDKSVADCVEALIGAYLVEMGARGALIFMSWLGIHVLPTHTVDVDPPAQPPPRPETDNLSSFARAPGPVGARQPYQDEQGKWKQVVYGELKAPPSPLLRYIDDPEGELELMLSGYEELERTLQYRFKDRSLLLQALSHASHQRNRLTDCYQRLEFLGDAVLDYLISRHLFEDARRHTPGALTDLRSALVNNTIFATLAVRHGFHKFFRHMSPGLNDVLTKYVRIQEENGHSISEEHYLIQEDELEQAEDVEVPKALGDLFESVAGAIFLDSGMSLGAVWSSYVRLMGAELEAFSAAAPKSPVRELLEAEPDTAKFGKPERLADGRRVRVCVEVFGRGTFKGIGRNYRIAKGTAARCALRHLRIHRR